MTIRVMTVDDQEIVHLGLKKLFEGTDIDVVGEAYNAKDAFKLAKQQRPDVILLDIRLPGGDGLSCLARIKKDLPSLRVIMFSAHDDPVHVTKSLAAGAHGFLTKDRRGKDIIRAVRAVAGGANIWSENSLHRAVDALVIPHAEVKDEVKFTKRESQVLNLIAMGLSNKEIGESLDISHETVKEHVNNVFRKIGVADRTKAAVWAVRRNLA